jgi:thioredoxin-related protein
MPRHRWISIGVPEAHKGLRVLIWLVILTCALLLPSDFARAAELPPITRDLRADGAGAAQQHLPLLLFFTLADCPYCERVRREYLGPMAADADQAKRVLIRELPIEASVTGFDGTPSSARQIAARYKVNLFPTVVMVDAHGTEIAEPLVGFSSPDFYGGLLDRRIDTANEKIRQN